MKLIRFTHSSAKGFTLIEFMVNMLVASVILLPALSFTTLHRRVLVNDSSKTKLVQNLRGALDVIGATVRVAGENLPSSFPAVLVTSGLTDEIRLRRNLIDEILPVCSAVTAGNTQITFGVTTSPPAGCVYSGQTTAYNSWRNYRINNGGTVKAYIYNSSTKTGEFFFYSGEQNTGSIYRINSTSGLGGSYPVGSSTVFILEEWKIDMSSDMLRLIENNDSASPLNVAFGMTDFQASVYMQDGSTKTSFAGTDQWNQIKSIELALSGSENSGYSSISRTISGRYFPRNVLSN